MQILNGTSPYDLLPKGSIYPIQRNQTVQVSMPGGLLNISHPMHLHGVSARSRVISWYTDRKLPAYLLCYQERRQRRPERSEPCPS